MKNHDNLFSIRSIIPHILLIAIIIGAYYFVSAKDLFPQWIDYLYYGGKALIALIFILASARSVMMPILGLIVGLLILFTCQVYNISILSSADAWELISIAFAGLIITVLVKW